MSRIDRPRRYWLSLSDAAILFVVIGAVCGLLWLMGWR